ncbi:MAG: hypothetical protein HOO87_11740 [Methyloglobulus sp.]|nr:hypothetical protein [Methyloglobulus sp.]
MPEAVRGQVSFLDSFTVSYAIQYPQGTRAETYTVEGYNSLLRAQLGKVETEGQVLQ